MRSFSFGFSVGGLRAFPGAFALLGDRNILQVGFQQTVIVRELGGFSYLSRAGRLSFIDLLTARGDGAMDLWSREAVGFAGDDTEAALLLGERQRGDPRARHADRLRDSRAACSCRGGAAQRLA